MKKLKGIQYILILLAFIIGMIIFLPLKNSNAETTYNGIVYGNKSNPTSYNYNNAMKALFADKENSVGKIISMNDNNVFKNNINNHIYCLATNSTSNSVTKYYAYEVTQYLKIVGNTLTTGNTTYNDTTYYSNAKLAYLLGGSTSIDGDVLDTGYKWKNDTHHFGNESLNQNTYTARQVELWYYLYSSAEDGINYGSSDHKSKIKSAYGVTSDTDVNKIITRLKEYWQGIKYVNNYTNWREDNIAYNATGVKNRIENKSLMALRKEMDEYANKIKNYKKASIGGKTEDYTASVTVTSTNATKDGKPVEKIGPFNFTFTGNYDGIEVKDTNGNIIDSSYITTDTIASKTQFYVYNSSKTQNAGSIKIKVKSTLKHVITAEMYVIYNSHEQPKIIVNPSKGNITDTAAVTFNVVNDGKIVVNKTDKDTGANLNAKFKIYVTSSGWLNKSESGIYTYTNNFDNATIFETTNGALSVEELRYGNYRVYEVEAPNGYILSEQDNYVENEAENYYGAQIGGTYQTIDKSNKTITFNATNKRKISISGYVWLDKPSTKDNKYNDLYDANEQKLAGITVNLKEKSTENIIATAITDSNGQYTLPNCIEKTDLSGYYVEFDYSNTGYKKTTIPVVLNISEPNGSRAIYEQIKGGDTYLTGIVSTYTGTKEEDKYGLSGNLAALYKDSTNVLENINLGLKQLPETTYTLQQDLDSANIIIGDMTYNYKYGKRGDKQATNEYENVPIVKWQGENISSYSADIYPSDIANAVVNNKNIDVTVTYKINIENTTNIDIETLYKENKLIIKQLKNTFDNTRYELVDSNWEEQRTKENETTVRYIGSEYDGGIDSKENKAVKITFKVKPEAIKQILNYPDGIIEKHPTEAQSTAYHEYTRNDYSWDNNINKTQEHYTTSEAQADSAPYLTFRISKKDREGVSGIVFKDNVKQDDPKGEILGDGIYEGTTEKGISNVTVELYDKENNRAKLYTTVKSPTENGEVVVETESTISDYTSLVEEKDAQTETNEKGEYSFEGISLGEYYVKFTYGNQEQHKISEYKSTVVTSEKVQNVIKGIDTSKDWYKNIEGSKYSVATDNLTTRKEYNADNSTHTTITAQTPNFQINSTDISELDVFNFGIIEQAKQKLEIDKVIKNIKITNTQGNVVITGNPGTDSIEGLTALDVNGEAVGYIRLELPEDEIYGSKLTITYEVILTNVSDINYYETEGQYEGWYYKFGDTTHAKELTTTANKVIDYLDPSLTYVSSSPDSRVTEEENLSEYTEYINKQENRIETEYTRDEDYDKVLLIENWEELYSNKKNGRKSVDSVEIIVERTLTTEDEDMEFISTAEIIIAKDPTSQLVPNKVQYTEAEDAIASIMPPTGADTQLTVFYIIAGIISLTVIAIGATIIKKKVL